MTEKDIHAMNQWAELRAFHRKIGEALGLRYEYWLLDKIIEES